MKPLVILMLFLSASICSPLNFVYAQTIDYNRIILPENAQNISDVEKLVQLAWKNNPVNQILDNRILMAKEQIKVERGAWTDDFKLTGRVNEFMINPPADGITDAIYFPAYSFGIEIPLSIFSHSKAKAASINVQNEMLAVNEKKLQIRAEVFENYHHYTFNQTALKIQTEVAENASNTFALIQDRFKNGQATLDEYNNAYNNLKSEQLKRAEAQRNFQIAATRLERLIGLDINAALAR